MKKAWHSFWGTKPTEKSLAEIVAEKDARPWKKMQLPVLVDGKKYILECPVASPNKFQKRDVPCS